jgi:glycine betaine/proline transport system substrate-binding protein
MSLTKAASTKFANKAENKPIIDFIKNYSIPTADVNKSLAFYMDESDGDMVATAKNFLSNNKMWEKWVPSDVAKKVKASL